MPKSKKLKIVFLENEPQDPGLVPELLRTIKGTPIQLQKISYEEKMLKRVAAERYDLTLLHFNRLDELAKKILKDLYNRVIWRPIIVIFDEGDEGDFEEAIRIGADDFLLGPNLDVKTLVRSMVLAIERTNRSRARSGLSSTREIRTTDSIMDRLPMGVLLVNGEGRVMLINRKAQEIANMNDGFQVDAEGRCRTAKPEETRALFDLIKQTAMPSGDSHETEFALSLTRPSLKQPLVLLVTPVGGDSGEGKRAGGAAIFISDPEESAEISNEVLTRLYGLTNAEARVVIGLSQGKRLEALADELGVSVSTTRHQLKQVFRKTDTTRQSELIKLILTGPAAILGNEQPEKKEKRKPARKSASG